MKVISGSLKGRRLNSIDHKMLRPSMMKTKEAVFSILTSLNAIINNNVLDLCSGIGAYGIEALSRGANFVTFVDFENSIINVLKQNIEQMRITEQTEIICSNILKLRNLKRKYQLLFLDPPYNTNIVTNFLNSIYKYDFIDDNALIVIESEKNSKFNHNNLELIKENVYSNTKVTILKNIGDNHD